MSNNQYLTHEFIFFDCFFDINQLIEFNELVDLFDNIYRNELGFILSQRTNKQYNFINNINKLIEKTEKIFMKTQYIMIQRKHQLLKQSIKAIQSKNIIKQPIFLQNIKFEDNHDFYLLEENQEFLEHKTIFNHYKCSCEKYECIKILNNMFLEEQLINVTLLNYSESIVKHPPKIFLQYLQTEHIENIFIKILKYTSNIHIYDRYITNNFIENAEGERDVTEDFFHTIHFISELIKREFPNKLIKFHLHSEINNIILEKIELFKNYIRQNFTSDISNIQYIHNLYHRSEHSRLIHIRYIKTDHHLFSIPDGSDFITIGIGGTTNFKPSQKRGNVFEISIEPDKVEELIFPTFVIESDIITDNFRYKIHKPKY